MAKRTSGVNIPIFSLRTKNSLGSGEFLDLIPFADWANEAGLKVIQVLPINDTSQSVYPYSILSAYALHPLYLNIQELDPKFSEQIEPIIHALNRPKLDYEKTMRAKNEFLRMFFLMRGEEDLSSKSFQTFFAKNKEHLKPYAAFCTLRDKHQTSDFSKWKKHAKYSEILVEDICEGSEVKYYYFVQYHLDKQLRKSRTHLKKQKVLLKGDFPMGVHPKSVEAWRFPEYFRFDQSMGAPPDFYNDQGQNWGFPSYNWEEIRADGYYFLKSRLKWLEQYFDIIRLDHVLGYFRLWEIPKGETSGLMGNFYPAKGYKEVPKEKEGDFLFRNGSYHPRIKKIKQYPDYFWKRQDALWKKEGKEKLEVMQKATSMMLCAEDIGVIPNPTKEVLAELKIPSLYVQRMPKDFSLEFEDPAIFPENSVCTPSNHDTSTLRAFWEEDPKLTERYYHTLLRQTGKPPEKLTEKLAEQIIQAHLNSKSKMAIFLLQDLLAMNEEIRFPDPKEARINDPAKSKDQWQWRMQIYVEELLLVKSFSKSIHQMIKAAKR